MEFWVIDRVEEGWAVCQNEQGEQQDLPIDCFLGLAKEGTWFTFSPEGKPVVSEEETKRRQDIAANLRKRLLSK